MKLEGARAKRPALAKEKADTAEMWAVCMLKPDLRVF